MYPRNIPVWPVVLARDGRYSMPSSVFQVRRQHDTTEITCMTWLRETSPPSSGLGFIQGSTGTGQLHQPVYHVCLFPGGRRLGGWTWPGEDGGSPLRPGQDGRAGLAEPVQQARQLLRLKKLSLGLQCQLYAPVWPRLQIMHRHPSMKKFARTKVADQDLCVHTACSYVAGGARMHHNQ